MYEEPEKPSNALDYVQNHLHGGGPHTADVEALKAENADLKKQLEEVGRERREGGRGRELERGREMEREERGREGKRIEERGTKER